MKFLSYLFTVLAILISDVMCAVVAFNYRGMICGIEHAGFSAPANVAFLYAIPFAGAIIACVICAIFFRRKANKKVEEK